MPSLVWEPADALAFRCPVEDVGTLIPPAIAAELVDRAPRGLPPPQELRTRALSALLRIAEQGDGAAAVEAAKALLAEVAQQQAAAIPSSTNPAEPWLTGQRYAPAREGLPELRGGMPSLDAPDLQ